MTDLYGFTFDRLGFAWTLGRFARIGYEFIPNHGRMATLTLYPDPPAVLSWPILRLMTVDDFGTLVTSETTPMVRW